MKYFFSLTIILCSLLSHSQIKRIVDSTPLINGNGTVHYLDSNGKHFGFTTYKNGHPEGLFNLVDSAGSVLLTGHLKYDSSCIQYHPAIRYLLLIGKDTVGGKLFTNTFNTMMESANGILIDKQLDSLPEDPAPFDDIAIGFSEDAAILPVGKWQMILLDKKRLYEEVELDECGNTRQLTYYKEDGSIQNQFTFPSVNIHKRKSRF